MGTLSSSKGRDSSDSDWCLQRCRSGRYGLLASGECFFFKQHVLMSDCIIKTLILRHHAGCLALVVNSRIHRLSPSRAFPSFAPFSAQFFLSSSLPPSLPLPASLFPSFPALPFLACRENEDQPGLTDYEASFLRLLDKLCNGTRVDINHTGTVVKYVVIAHTRTAPLLKRGT